jgi:hypothetical protein
LYSTNANQVGRKYFCSLMTTGTPIGAEKSRKKAQLVTPDCEENKDQGGSCGIKNRRRDQGTVHEPAQEKSNPACELQGEAERQIRLETGVLLLRPSGKLKKGKSRAHREEPPDRRSIRELKNDRRRQSRKSRPRSGERE